MNSRKCQQPENRTFWPRLFSIYLTFHVCSPPDENQTHAQTQTENLFIISSAARIGVEFIWNFRRVTAAALWQLIFRRPELWETFSMWLFWLSVIYFKNKHNEWFKFCACGRSWKCNTLQQFTLCLCIHKKKLW